MATKVLKRPPGFELDLPKPGCRGPLGNRLGPRDVIEEPARDLTAANWDRLRHLAGRPPPRTGRHEAQTLEPQAADVAASFAELLAGVGEEPATAAEDSHNQLLHKLLVMQTALLERSLASKPSDSVTAALATGGSDNTAGVRGYAAREAFLRQLGQHRDVAAAVASNAARELGLLESQVAGNLIWSLCRGRYLWASTASFPIWLPSLLMPGRMVTTRATSFCKAGRLGA